MQKLMQNKVQSEKARFKTDFIDRLVNFSVDIVKFSEDLRINRNYWPIADQLIRSSTSVGANVVEAQAASSKRDYIKFFQIALKSANETKYWLLVIIKLSLEKPNVEANKLLKEVNELANILGSSVLTLKGKR